jgi:hypothetical protein
VSSGGGTYRVRQHHRRAVRLTPSANYRLIEHYVNSQRSRYRRAFCACQERFVGVLSRFAWGSAGFVSGSFGGGLPDSEDLRAPLLLYATPACFLTTAATLISAKPVDSRRASFAIHQATLSWLPCHPEPLRFVGCGLVQSRGPGLENL